MKSGTSWFRGISRSIIGLHIGQVTCMPTIVLLWFIAVTVCEARHVSEVTIIIVSSIQTHVCSTALTHLWYIYKTRPTDILRKSSQSWALSKLFYHHHRQEDIYITIWLPFWSLNTMPCRSHILQGFHSFNEFPAHIHSCPIKSCYNISQNFSLVSMHEGKCSSFTFNV